MQGMQYFILLFYFILHSCVSHSVSVKVLMIFLLLNSNLDLVTNYASIMKLLRACHQYIALRLSEK